MKLKIDYVSYLKDRINAEDLSNKQRQELLQLNKILMQLEQGIKTETRSLTAVYNQKVEDSQEWIKDYETELEISFWLKETDSAFDEDSDNILVILYEGLKYNDFKVQLGSQTNHNEFQNRENHPMSDDFHCWLFHCLYHHTDLGWTDILRVGTIWVD